jgi:histidyl-tRNA synthetase
MLIAEPPPPPRPVALVPIGETGEHAALNLAEQLRNAGFSVDLGYSGNLARRLRRANKLGARAAVLIGDDEIGRGVAALRDLDTGSQTEVPLGELAARIAALGG